MGTNSGTGAAILSVFRQIFWEVRLKACFGTIYPDFAEFRFNQQITGKVFQMKINTLGPGHRDRHMELDAKAWEECQSCEHYRSCFDLSNAKLSMQRAMAQI